MDNALLFEIKGFSGVNNIDPDWRMPVAQVDKPHIGVVADMGTIDNLDIDNVNSLKTRLGSVEKITGTDIHSLWSNGSVCFYVDETTLYSMSALYAGTALKTGLTPNARMTYQEVNDRIYMTNGTWIGYYKEGTIYDLTIPTMTYKAILPAGQHMTFYQGQLYIASNNVLYIADALSDHFDVRYGYRQFLNNITMLHAVGKGIYASDGKTWFMTRSPALRTDEPDEFRREEVLSVGAIPYTDVEISGSDVKDGEAEDYLIWMSQEGVCLGSGDGKVFQATITKYHLPDYAVGSACLRKASGVNHYIATLG